MMNKKGATPSVIVDFIGYGIFIIMIVVFFFLFNLAAQPKINAVTSTQFPSIQAEQIMLNYLRTPVEFNGENITTAQYVGILYNTKNSNMIDKVKRDFDAIYAVSGRKFCYLTVSDTPGPQLINYYIFNNQCTITDYAGQGFGMVSAPIVLPDGTIKYLQAAMGYKIIPAGESK